MRRRAGCPRGSTRRPHRGRPRLPARVHWLRPARGGPLPQTQVARLRRGPLAPARAPRRLPSRRSTRRRRRAPRPAWPATVRGTRDTTCPTESSSSYTGMITTTGASGWTSSAGGRAGWCRGQPDPPPERRRRCDQRDSADRERVAGLEGVRGQRDRERRGGVGSHTDHRGRGGRLVRAEAAGGHRHHLRRDGHRGDADRLPRREADAGNPRHLPDDGCLERPRQDGEENHDRVGQASRARACRRVHTTPATSKPTEDSRDEGEADRTAGRTEHERGRDEQGESEDGDQVDGAQGHG